MRNSTFLEGIMVVFLCHSPEDGFLLALNTALGADPEKGRAAAARAAQIGRRLRQRLGELMEAKGADLEKVLEMILGDKSRCTSMHIWKHNPGGVDTRVAKITLAVELYSLFCASSRLLPRGGCSPFMED